MQNTAQQTADVITNRKPNRTPGTEISNLFQRQKELRIKINNTKEDSKKIELKKEKNEVLHQIRKKVTQLRNEELNKQAEAISSAQTDDVMFSAVKACNLEKFENPKVEDSEGKLITNPNEILKTVANHFENRFKDINTPEIPSFIGKPKPLNHPITQAGIRKNLNRLKNNKAPGEDQIYPELLKYSTSLLDKTIASILNSTFTKDEELDINSGVLIAIPKPGKPKGPPNNLRPITLLNILRKVLSLITLDRIRPSIEQYLSHSQSGFRPERSTSDVVWTHRWLAAKTVTENKYKNHWDRHVSSI